MASWRVDAVVWVNDKTRGQVVVGAYGFAWWEGRRVAVVAFPHYQTAALTTYTEMSAALDNDLVQRFDREAAPLSAVLRFVRTGLPPVQGRFAPSQ